MARLWDQKMVASQGGGYTVANTWVTRALNQKEEGGLGVTLASNQFVLPSGKYHVSAFAPGHRVDTFRIRLQDITNVVTEALGGLVFSGNNTQRDSINANVSAYLDISGNTMYEIQFIAETVRAGDGLGYNGIASPGASSIFTTVTIERISD